MSEKIYHITTPIHDSRTSSRMIKFNVRKLREMGTNPYPNIIYFTQEEELLVTQTISKIVKDDNLKLLAYNICSDHIHLLLSCDIDHVSKIM
ncbi:transposase [Polaribacter litorisediminis]|uniref:transposase n=1 Tax=Polaribacter litorisediminis TaxID=1908341 RepID=UPI001CBFB124|nr:transposase [Polaribacter litorisediminis]UAM97507.1 transposase [Polaribacter litorisediminis]